MTLMFKRAIISFLFLSSTFCIRTLLVYFYLNVNRDNCRLNGPSDMLLDKFTSMASRFSNNHD
jgi:hypothetical protein